MAKHELTGADIMPMDEYVKVRSERRRAVTELKKNRRLAVGPDATFYFECFETMWHQVHEMLYIEPGGEARIADELAAYNPLIPKGSELVATLMFEIDDAEQNNGDGPAIAPGHAKIPLGEFQKVLMAQHARDRVHSIHRGELLPRASYFPL